MKRKLLFLAIILTVVWAGPASAVSFWSFDEYGHSSFGPGFMAADPGPGGLPLALTYNFPFPVIPGDVLMMEGEVLSDVIRFNNNGTLIFYSDYGTEPGVLADTGFPTGFYGLTASIIEVGTEGNNWAFYTPGPGQPGYNEFSQMNYQFISDVVPVAPSVLLFGSGLLGLAGLGWRRRS